MAGASILTIKGGQQEAESMAQRGNSKKAIIASRLRPWCMQPTRAWLWSEKWGDQSPPFIPASPFPCLSLPPLLDPAIYILHV